MRSPASRRIAFFTSACCITALLSAARAADTQNKTTVSGASTRSADGRAVSSCSGRLIRSQ